MKVSTRRLLVAEGAFSAVALATAPLAHGARPCRRLVFMVRDEGRDVSTVGRSTSFRVLDDGTRIGTVD